MDTVNMGRRGQEYWNGHVSRADEFDGSNAEYCRHNGLSLGTFYSHKKRLRQNEKVKIKDKENAFLKIEPLTTNVQTEKSASFLPDAKWLGELILVLAGRET
jgi:hypothetical protein